MAHWQLSGMSGVCCEDFDDGRAVLAAHRHEEAGHDREVEAHVELVAVAEVDAHVGGPLVGLGQQHLVPAVLRVDRLAQPLEEGVRLREVLAVGALALEEVGHGVAAEAVHAHVQPEAHDVQHGLLDLGVVVVEVRLVAEEAVPEVLLGHRIPRPVGALGVGEDDAGALVLVVRVAPDVVVALGALGIPARLLEPGVLVAGVVDDELADDADVALVGLVHQALEVRERAVVRVDRVVVRDVVAVVLQGRGVVGQEPQAGDAQVLQVRQLLDEAGDVPVPIRVRVIERADVQFVDDCLLVPERIRPGHKLAWGLIRSSRTPVRCGGSGTRPRWPRAARG